MQIADEAEIAPSTFFNYFPAKVDIVFALFDAVIESARERILDRPDDEDAKHAVLAWVEEDLHEVEAPYSEALRQIPRIVASVPGAAGRGASPPPAASRTSSRPRTPAISASRPTGCAPA